MEIDGETHLAIKDLAGLISLVQIGVLEIHPWGSTVDNVEQPDRITFDLDPDIGLPWSQVTAAALEIRDALEGFGLQSFAKTTGGKGLHVVVPLTPELGWDEVKSFTKAVGRSHRGATPATLHHQPVEAGAARPDLHRLSSQCPRRHRDRRLFDPRAAGRADCDPAVLARGRGRGPARRLYRRDRPRPPGRAEIRPLGRDRHSTADDHSGVAA